MRDVFPDEKTEGSPNGDHLGGDAEAARIRDGLEGQQVCPFCGVISNGAHPVCEKCTMENSAVARQPRYAAGRRGGRAAASNLQGTESSRSGRVGAERQ